MCHGGSQAASSYRHTPQGKSHTHTESSALIHTPLAYALDLARYPSAPFTFPTWAREPLRKGQVLEQTPGLSHP